LATVAHLKAVLQKCSIQVRVAGTIGKIEFHHDPEYDKVFPGKRLSRVEVTLERWVKFSNLEHENQRATEM
jgi:2-methylcitrate dehydratase PrpD